MSQNDKQAGPPLHKQLGAGLVAGAADDDPSGIATYSQAGAQFGLGMLWLIPFSYPLMSAIQLTSARLAIVTGRGLAANLRMYYSQRIALTLTVLLLVANVFNIGADLSAMAYASQLLLGGNYHVLVTGFALLSLGLQILLPFKRYSPVLKILTLTLLAYVATLITVNVPWTHVLERTVWPSFAPSREFAFMVVAVLGTTISPYLFFWQSAQEVEEMGVIDGRQPLTIAPHRAAAEIRRVKIDTFLGMGFASAVAFCIMLTAAVALNAHGITHIETTQEAAKALEPVAGEHAFLLYTLGIIGTGMLAVPVLAGSAAYALAETFTWRASLSLSLIEARGFYAVLTAAVLIAVALDFNDVDPVRELFWSAIINGVVSVPLMIFMLLLAQRSDAVGRWVLTRRHRFFGWCAVGVMLVAVVVMLAQLIPH
jgi:Mn2+/Fe2+ NRAMP family transporter